MIAEKTAGILKRVRLIKGEAILDAYLQAQELTEQSVGIPK
ncbi:hypothetical protein [Neolewinella persica]|nr:hypothetical protein [Neolewinella persica]